LWDPPYHMIFTAQIRFGNPAHQVRMHEKAYQTNWF